MIKKITYNNDLVEVEEHYKDGVVWKRTLNGVEIPVDTIPMKHFKSVMVEEEMTREEFNEVYGPIFPSSKIS